MAEAHQAIERNYDRPDLGATILAALKQAGKDVEHLTPDDLAAVDEFHTGQRGATIRLAELLHLRGSERVVDVGCGIGGPSRFLAKQYGCRVSGLDLTSGFVRVADMLAHLTGLSALVAPSFVAISNRLGEMSNAITCEAPAARASAMAANPIGPPPKITAVMPGFQVLSRLNIAW